MRTVGNLRTMIAKFQRASTNVKEVMFEMRWMQEYRESSDDEEDKQEDDEDEEDVEEPLWGTRSESQ